MSGMGARTGLEGDESSRFMSALGFFVREARCVSVARAKKQEAS